MTTNQRFLFLALVLLPVWGSIIAQNNIEILHTAQDINYTQASQRIDYKPLKNDKYGLKNGIYWLKIKALNNIGENLIRLKSHHITKATAIDNTGHLIRPQSYTLFPTFRIDEKPNVFPVIIKLQLDQEAYFTVDFISQPSLELKQQSTLFGYGLFYGALFFIVIMNLILYVVTREGNFWTYAALLLCVGTALAFRDNLPYLFNWHNQWVLDIEILSHILIGIFGGFFAYSFIDMKHKNHKLGKFFIFGFGVLSIISMIIYWINLHFIYYALADLFIFLSIVSLWVVSFSLRKESLEFYIVFAVLGINIYFILDFLVLHNFGVTLLNLNSLAIKLGIVGDMIILSIAIITDWQKLKVRSDATMEDLKIKAAEIENLSQYKRQDDHNDMYLESLIENHDLTNREVKILQMLAAGQTKPKIANTLKINRTALDESILSLYAKLGIQDDSDLNTTWA